MFSMPETTKAGETTAPPCTDLPLSLFFPKLDGGHVDRPTKPERDALAVCKGCPLAARQRCLDEALKYPIHKQFGVVGGTTAAQRKAILWTRRRQLAEVA